MSVCVYVYIWLWYKLKFNLKRDEKQILSCQISQSGRKDRQATSYCWKANTERTHLFEMWGAAERSGSQPGKGGRGPWWGNKDQGEPGRVLNAWDVSGFGRASRKGWASSSQQHRFDACCAAGFSGWGTGPAARTQDGHGQVRTQDQHIFLDHRLYSTVRHFTYFNAKIDTDVL